MEKIVIIGANDFQNPLILKAKEMGFETHVFAWQVGDVGEKSADYFYPISIMEKDEILNRCRYIKPAAVLTIASDLAAITANYVARELGLPANSEQCVLQTTNKYIMRQCLKNSGLSVPAFALVDETDYRSKTSQFHFPLIVKPTDRSGSRSITKVTSIESMEEAVIKAVTDSFEKKAIVEEYIEGEEYSFEAVSYHGEHHFLAITKKFTTGSPHFIETGHIEPAGFSKEEQDEIKHVIWKALDALGVENGASHSEFRISPEGKVKIIEIGARMGGDCIGSDLVMLSTGYDFLKMVIEVGIGQAPSITTTGRPGTAAIKFILKEADLAMLNQLQEKNSNAIIRISKIEEIGHHRVVDSGSRYGYYITMFENRDDALRIFE